MIHGRRGVTLVEVMVVIAILLALALIAVPSIYALSSLQERQAAKDLAVTYEALHDEAVLRNVTFRLAFHIDEGFYEVEVGSPQTLIFEDPQARADFEQKQQDAMKLLTKEEKAAEEAKTAQESDFQKLQDLYDTHVALPGTAMFGGVYTPEYGKLMTPLPDGPSDNDPAQVIYSYIFPNGFSEPAVIQIVDRSDPTNGYTVEVEAMSGVVHLHTEVVGPDDIEAAVPDAPPELPN